MKRFVLAMSALLLFAGSFVSAERSVLIDFTELTRDTALVANAEDTENGPTIVDFSALAGTGFSDTDRALMRTSLALNNWEVELSSSSRTVENQSLSLAREAITKADARQYLGEAMANRTLLGVRVHFPDAPFNSFARVRPPFEIPAFSGADGNQFVNIGVVKNVGVLKSVEVTVYGSNFPNGLALVLKNERNEEQQIFLGYLTFDGWRTLQWDNPNYITEVRNRDLRRLPLYPRSQPFVKFDSLIVYRDREQEGGDIVTYFKDIVITYDLAVLEPQRDIEDEEIWGILQEREASRERAELNRLGDLQVLRFLERQKMHQEEAEVQQ
jgi:hypothetical protein